jgi:putative toxin-antitoxin system antitoxin component (TIGR02293 family)
MDTRTARPTKKAHMSLNYGSNGPKIDTTRYPMSMPAERVEEILGLKPTARGMAGLAAAVERGLPRSALIRVIARTGVTGKARLALLHGIVPSATFKRRTRLKLHESEKTERLARVIALAELLWDDPAAAQRFLSTPHPELQNRTPLDNAATELGARQVEDLVMRAIYGLPV